MIFARPMPCNASWHCCGNLVTAYMVLISGNHPFLEEVRIMFDLYLIKFAVEGDLTSEETHKFKIASWFAM